MGRKDCGTREQRGDRNGAQGRPRDVVKRQMKQGNAPCPPGSQSRERSRGTQEIWSQADLGAPSHWPRGCKRTQTGETQSALSKEWALN